MGIGHTYTIFLYNTAYPMVGFSLIYFFTKKRMGGGCIWFAMFSTHANILRKSGLYNVQYIGQKKMGNLGTRFLMKILKLREEISKFA